MGHMTRMAGKLVAKGGRYEKTDRERMPPNDSLSGARAGAQRGVSWLGKIMNAFMGIP